MLQNTRSGATKMGERRSSRLRVYLTPHVLLLLSTLIYFSPYLFGSFEYLASNGQRYEREYSSDLGVAIAFVLFMLGVCVMLFGKRRVFVEGLGPQRIESQVLSLLICLSGLYVLLSGHASIANKQILLEETSRIDLSFYLFCSLGFVFSALTGFKQNRSLFVLSVIGLLFILYIGHRSSLVIAVIGAAYVTFRDRPIPRIPLKHVALAVLLFFAVAVYKSIYVAVKLGRWDLVAERLSLDNILYSSLAGMEQFTTLAHLDFIITDNFQLACSNAWLMPFSVLPFSDILLSRIWDVSGCSYNAQVQPVFFSGYSGGVAANIWAEFFGYFGYLGFPILISALTLSYTVLEYLMRRVRSPVLVSGLVIALVNFSFYIQRKELFGAFISGKRAFTVALIVFVIAWILRTLNRRAARF